MFFLLRLALWLGVVCVLLPSSNPRSDAPATPIDVKQAVTLASAAVSDARGFCERQPNACAVGGKMASAIGHKAEAGARTLYHLISAQFADSTASTPVATAPAAKPQARTGKVVAVSTRERGTLTASDLRLNWHAPVPLPPRRAPRPSA